MSETKADTTSMGLFLISFLMLVLTIVGFFGFTENKDFMGVYVASTMVAWILTIGFLFITFTMWKAGSKFLMIIFGLLTVFIYAYGVVGLAEGGASTQFFFIAIAIMMIILGLIALLNKAGFMLTLLLICAGLVFLFYGLLAGAFVGGDEIKNFALLIGVFALISFVISIWMALAMETDLGLPVM